MTVYERIEKARPAFKAIVKNRTNPHFKSRYADLEAVLDGVEEALRAQGVGIFQRPALSLGNAYLVTELRSLEDGDFIRGVLPLPTDADPQKMGSAITYGRRYQIVTMLGLVTEDDDDGEASTTSRPPRQVEAPKPKPATPASAGAVGSPAPAATGTPEGWFSQADCVQAHNEIADRISKLPAKAIAECGAYRDTHGWPMSAAEFAILTAQVDKVESEAAQRVAEAFPGTVIE